MNLPDRTWTLVHYYSPYTGYNGGWYLFSDTGQLHCRNVTWSRALRYLAALLDAYEVAGRTIWDANYIYPLRRTSD